MSLCYTNFLYQTERLSTAKGVSTLIGGISIIGKVLMAFIFPVIRKILPQFSMTTALPLSHWLMDYIWRRYVVNPPDMQVAKDYGIPVMAKFSLYINNTEQHWCRNSTSSILKTSYVSIIVHNLWLSKIFGYFWAWIKESWSRNAFSNIFPTIRFSSHSM